MAGTQPKKNVRDFKTSDQMWKVYIEAEHGAEKIWRENWGWLLDEYE